jgi:excisionase family DNA binding protein
MSEDRLDALAEALADRAGPLIAEQVIEHLEMRSADVEPLLDAAGAAAFLGVTRATVYALVRAGKLPARHWGDGERPRLRFERRALVEHMTHTNTPPPDRSPRRRRRSQGNGGVDLLPIQESE